MGQPLVASAACYRRDVKVFEPCAHAIGAVAGGKAVAAELTVPMAALTSGTYHCQVGVLDLDGKKMSF